MRRRVILCSDACRSRFYEAQKAPVGRAVTRCAECGQPALATSQPMIIDDYLDAQVATFNTMWAMTHVLDHAQTTRQAVEGTQRRSRTRRGAGGYVARVLLVATGVKQTPYSRLKEGIERNRFRGHRLSGEFVNVPIA